MGSAANEDLERNARGNEDRFEQIEVELNRALELLDEDGENYNPSKARERVEHAAHMAGQGIRLNLVATQK
jgi:hypothetical protein